MEAVGTAAGLLTYLIGGYLADKLGRRLLFLAGLIATAIGLVIFVGERSFAPFVVAYTFTNIGGSLAWPCLTALMADKTSPADMKYFFSVQGFVNQMGTTLATFFGIFMPALLRDSYGTELVAGYGYVFLVTVVCSLVPIMYVLRVTEKNAKPEKLIVHFDRKMQKMLAVYAFQNGLFGVGAAFVIPWFPLIFERGMDANLYDVSLIITLSNIVLAVGWLVVPKFAEIRGSVVLVAVAQIASVVPFVLIPFTDSLIIVALLYTFRNFLMIVPMPVLNAYLVNVVSREIRASFLSLGQLAWMAGFAPAVAIAGHLWNDDYSKAEPFFYASALYIVATLIFWAYFKNITDPGDARNNSQAK
jgi:MFS family permease